MEVAVILGTRPEIVKMSPVIRQLEKQQVPFFILHTGQHYSHSMDTIFFPELEISDPKYNLYTKSGSHAEQTGHMLIAIEKVLIQEKSAIVLVEGDTNTVLAGGLAAAKLDARVGHVEAGLRSNDRHMPEELNRILVDHLSEYLFAPTNRAKDTLLAEGIAENKIHVTGNTIVDAIYQNIDIARGRSHVLDDLGLKPRDYFLVTTHRQENVDSADRLEAILESLRFLYQKYRVPQIFPLHPRAKARIENSRLRLHSGIRVIEPVGFLDFLNIEANAALILTDSGGVQEESCVLRVPCVTLRDNTERPETLEAGSNDLAGVDGDRILDSAARMLARKRNWANPFGDGQAAVRIVQIIREAIESFEQ